ncbi:unnamed protein product [Amoebophrya sp. A120]|nr:unnamed protein product [Amoebophrya sp. A120]|eukprot:GSA120T00024728001.1
MSDAGRGGVQLPDKKRDPVCVERGNSGETVHEPAETHASSSSSSKHKQFPNGEVEREETESKKNGKNSKCLKNYKMKNAAKESGESRDLRGYLENYCEEIKRLDEHWYGCPCVGGHMAKNLTIEKLLYKRELRGFSLDLRKKKFIDDSIKLSDWEFLFGRSSLCNLERLDLGGCGLENLEKTIEETSGIPLLRSCGESRLWWLNLSGNNLSNLNFLIGEWRRCFEPFSRLEFLILDNNPALDETGFEEGLKRGLQAVRGSLLFVSVNQLFGCHDIAELRKKMFRTLPKLLWFDYRGQKQLPKDERVVDESNREVEEGNESTGEEDSDYHEIDDYEDSSVDVSYPASSFSYCDINRLRLMGYIGMVKLWRSGVRIPEHLQEYSNKKYVRGELEPLLGDRDWFKASGWRLLREVEDFGLLWPWSLRAKAHSNLLYMEEPAEVLEELRILYLSNLYELENLDFLINRGSEKAYKGLKLGTNHGNCVCLTTSKFPKLQRLLLFNCHQLTFAHMRRGLEAVKDSLQELEICDYENVKGQPHLLGFRDKLHMYNEFRALFPKLTVWIRYNDDDDDFLDDNFVLHRLRGEEKERDFRDPKDERWFPGFFSQLSKSTGGGRSAVSRPAVSSAVADKNKEVAAAKRRAKKLRKDVKDEGDVFDLEKLAKHGWEYSKKMAEETFYIYKRDPDKKEVLKDDLPPRPKGLLLKGEALMNYTTLTKTVEVEEWKHKEWTEQTFRKKEKLFKFLGLNVLQLVKKERPINIRVDEIKEGQNIGGTLPLKSNAISPQVSSTARKPDFAAAHGGPGDVKDAGDFFDEEAGFSIALGATGHHGEQANPGHNKRSRIGDAGNGEEEYSRNRGMQGDHAATMETSRLQVPSSPKRDAASHAAKRRAVAGLEAAGEAPKEEGRDDTFLELV